MASLKERFGNEPLEYCANDDVSSLRTWAEQHTFKDWAELLIASTESDAVNVAKYCLEQGAKPGLLVLSSIGTCGAEHIHRLLVGHGLGIDEYIEGWKSALASAVVHKNLSWARFCLDKGADPNLPKLDDYRSILAEAAGNGDIKIMKLLLAHGAERTNSGALVYAAEEGQAESIKFLLQEGFDINEIGIEEPTDPRSREDVGTALHKAIENHPNLVDLLLSTDMSLKDGQGRTPVELAQQLKKKDVLEKLKA